MGGPALLASMTLVSALQLGIDTQEPPMGPGRRARLLSRQHSAEPSPTWISINPLRDLDPLPKVHYNNQGIDISYMTTGHGTSGTSLEMLVDYARITGSFPAILDTAGTLETAVEICINASKLHPTGRLPHLQVGGSPWFNVHGGDAAVNRSIEAAEVAKWRTEFEQSARLLAAANAKFGSHVVIGCAQFDVESWSWSPNYQGVAGKQEIIDGIRRKSELIFNVTKVVLPDAKVIYYDYGASYWLPTGSVRGNGPGVPGPSCPDGWCTDLGFTLDESFLHDPAFMGFAFSAYWPYEPEFTRRSFCTTAANAKAAGLPGRNVVPYVSLGAAYMRNLSKWPDINAQAKETLRGPGFFDMPFEFSGPGYDLAYSTLLGAQINQPNFNSSGAWSAFGPWEQSHGASFFPGVFDWRSSPSSVTNGSTVVMDHFVACALHWISVCFLPLVYSQLVNAYSLEQLCARRHGEA